MGTAGSANGVAHWVSEAQKKGFVPMNWSFTPQGFRQADLLFLPFFVFCVFSALHVLSGCIPVSQTQK